MWYLVAFGENQLSFFTGYPARPYFSQNRRIKNMRSALRITIASAIAAAALAPALVSAQAKDGYLTDTAGNVVRALGAGVCVRSSQWTPALAVAECDPDLVKKPAPKAAPQKAKPAPQKAAPQKAAPKPKPKKPQMLNIEEKIELQGMEFNKAEMTADNKADLDKFLGALQKPTKARAAVQFGAVVVTGHTDRIGGLKYNMKLSERRAVVVKDYIVSKGVDSKLIFWEGKGPKQPIPVTKFCDNKMKRKQLIECLAPNRRVTVEVVGRAQSLAKPKAEAKPAAKKPAAKR
ncbi:MAG: OmpA family protein [Burkholderiales bacterium]|nr:OmpA family protein [Burkholderiales bacterium]